ncbi:MAG: ATP synthase F1 subunit delta [Phycisphaerales bacterium]
MHNDALAQVYARSLYELAEAAGGRDRIEESANELGQIAELMREQPRFRRFIESPIIDRAARSETLRRVFDGRISDLSLRFLLVLNAKDRLNALASITESFDHMVQEAFGRIEVDLFTAAPIGAEANESIRQRIKAALGKEPVIHSYADEHMIGGIKLKIGDQLIDGSVQTQLRRMKSELMQSRQALRERASEFMEE